MWGAWSFRCWKIDYWREMDDEDGGERVVDLTVEAEQSLREVSYALASWALSKTLSSTASCAYINLTTKESKEMTVRLSLRGFEIVGNSHDSCELENGDTVPGEAYETIYALLQNISPSYQLSFKDAVVSKLQVEMNTTSPENNSK